MATLADIPLARATLAELGEGDFSAADYFEAYGAKIEAEAKHEGEPTLSEPARAELLKLVEYFLEPSDDYRRWPSSGLRIFAMLAPIGVAHGVLGIPQSELEASLRSHHPNKGWEWWHGLGREILEDKPGIAERLGLTQRALHKYKKKLQG